MDWLSQLEPFTSRSCPEATKAVLSNILSRISHSVSEDVDGGNSTEHWFFQENGKSGSLRVVLCVLPKTESLSRHNCIAQPHAITAFVKKYASEKVPTLVTLLFDSEQMKSHRQSCFAAGCAVSRVGGERYSRKNGSDPATKSVDEKNTDHLSVLFSGPSLDDEYLKRLSLTAEGIQLTCRLVDAPCSELNTDAFVAEALGQVKELKHVESKVIRGADLEAQGFGGIYGVGKAAEHPPALVILSYNPTSATQKGVVMVGKGIVYDTGGLSIKTKEGMPGMKRDMGGAAAILGAFIAIVKSQSTSRFPLHAILCLAENSVSPIATRPDDIHVLYSGKSCEINNTDAEGRLVLADGASYAVKHLNPSVIIDMATLTGAQGVATGKYFGALYCNNESLEKVAVQAGLDSGDLVHGLPYAPEFFRPEFKSAVADMKNSVKNRANAQVSCAGQFIGNHLGSFEKEGKWLHIDMAYPSYTSADERATGFGVALLHKITMQIDADTQ